MLTSAEHDKTFKKTQAWQKTPSNVLAHVNLVFEM